MYDFIEGELAAKSPTEAVVSAGGVGYRFIIPVSTFDQLPPGGTVRLLAHLYVRDDEMRLYGFATEDERRLFARLIGISGIGPAIAIAILNGMSVDAFRQAAANEKFTEICAVKGVGRKTAERIVVEMRDEMARELVERPTAGVAAPTALTSDAVGALLVLGVKRSAAERAIGRAFEKLGRDTALEDVIREALEHV